MNISHYQPFGDVYIAFEASNKAVGLLRNVGRVKTRDWKFERPQREIRPSAFVSDERGRAKLKDYRKTVKK